MDIDRLWTRWGDGERAEEDEQLVELVNIERVAFAARRKGLDRKVKLVEVLWGVCDWLFRGKVSGSQKSV
jgi:hypothetical protein